MSNVKLGNPAVVGLAGFGMTTFVLQCHNLGWCGIAPVLWLGLCFGGTAQMIAGLMEFKTGNNFGFCAFTGYGAFWISLCLMIIFGKNADLVKAYPTLAFNANDLGFYLVAWTVFTFILFIASMKHHATLAFIFLTLLLGFIGLDVKEFTGSALAGTFAAYDLLVCAFSALYLMTVAVYAESGINLPVGEPWIKESTAADAVLAAEKVKA
ncbi:acetate uptake transporter [Geomonas sp. Red69]|uniref:Acetate uptake transporter n=1 Tax=Geomonas diazotrophica TaxID=2843197 RepID=A0ABX8JIW6_9BACT|nr:MULTISPECIES: acetate uptake transporter [Geomonas]MBU5638985.1 acetate uptake transporter [Geomonas diazotrophica]QWV98238.1 acetate uptake transporter [Geomonas nitrogeniifigens]QXE87422.1 acetate uptake transporter [Geomonas nitrogeniifigens]